MKAGDRGKPKRAFPFCGQIPRILYFGSATSAYAYDAVRHWRAGSTVGRFPQIFLFWVELGLRVRLGLLAYSQRANFENFFFCGSCLSSRLRVATESALSVRNCHPHPFGATRLPAPEGDRQWRAGAICRSCSSLLHLTPCS